MQAIGFDVDSKGPGSVFDGRLILIAPSDTGAIVIVIEGTSDVGHCS